MSGQAKRSRVRAAQAQRRAVARLIIDGAPLHWSEYAGSRDHAIDMVAAGDCRFDVHAARELGERMVGLEHEYTYFVDWTMTKGLGPDNRERGAFVAWCGTCDVGDRLSCGGLCVDGSGDVRGGWPGRLASEWTSTGGKRSAPMCRTLARQGHRLLDMLDGRAWWAPSAKRQPSECQACCGTATPRHGTTVATADGGEFTTRPGQRVAFVVNDGLTVAGRDGQPRRAVLGEAVVMTCPDCQGTGHNLRGVLSPVEWSPAIRRAVVDAHRERYRQAEPYVRGHVDTPPAWGDWPCWTTSSAVSGVPVDRKTTREVPRGEHRRCRAFYRPALQMLDDDDQIEDLDVRITSRGLSYAIPSDRLPRWRCAELRHAWRRRQRSVVTATGEHLDRLAPRGLMRGAGETDAEFRYRLIGNGSEPTEVAPP